MSSLKRRASGESRALVGQRAGEDEFRSSFPAIWEFLTLEVWPDGGEHRETGSILLFVQDGLVKCRLKDQDSNEVCFLAADGVWDVLCAANDALASGKGEWRPEKPWGSRKSPR